MGLDDVSCLEPKKEEGEFREREEGEITSESDDDVTSCRKASSYDHGRDSHRNRTGHAGHSALSRAKTLHATETRCRLQLYMIILIVITPCSNEVSRLTMRKCS